MAKFDRSIFKASSLKAALAVLAALCGTLATGCARTAGLAEGNMFQLPWFNDSGGTSSGYSLQKVSIPTYDDPRTLQGRFVKLYVDPFVANGRLEGATPVGRYIRNGDGVYIPADYVSLQAAAVHAHYERLSAITESTGVHLNWPMKIGIQANVVDKSGNLKNNAIFDSQLDALLVVPYMNAELPIALNGGILAHEHFHMIFQAVVLSTLGNTNDPVIGKPSASGSPLRALSDRCNITAPKLKKQRLLDVLNGTNTGRSLQEGDDEEKNDTVIYNAFLLRAMNEGLADFWGWVYTGDTKFIEHSLPSEKARDLSLKLSRLRSADTLLAETMRRSSSRTADEELVAFAYKVGSDYAKIMKELSVQLAGSGGGTPTLEQRVQSAQLLVRALPTLAQAAGQAKASRKPLSPNILLKGLMLQLPSVASVGGSTKAACDLMRRAAAFEMGSPLEGIACGGSDVPTTGPDVTAKAVWTRSER